MSLIPKFYLDAVVSIGVNQGSSISWIGTGFFVVKKVGDDEYLPLLITNRHVLQGKDLVVIRLTHKETGDLRIINMQLIANGDPIYSVHSDSRIDIAAVTINGEIITKNNLLFSAFNIDEHTLTSDEFLDRGGNAGSYIYMLGYPMGLVNIDSNSPICRGGCVARIDSNEISNKKCILLDVQNFPGNSGSPIITKPEVVSIQDSQSINQSVLIGIINSYIPYEEKLINSQTQRIVEVRSENSGIAIANPVEFIKEVVDMEIERVSTENVKNI